ncbi:polysaccharide lyase family 8 super-sandwich domain-containing protein [Pareuzebyella sediminis]|uniref:polysaccharide lyase family 8 super-sandwich domain-containing protein n=1 Tax=Pareuzebyella sediminis TaxID=2607998 RepID=UPI0011EDEB9F|nr:polysaccharide lyase family 8 super-sandwich domain-containing protein [Pareuzebyella sediminis]
MKKVREKVLLTLVVLMVSVPVFAIQTDIDIVKQRVVNELMKPVNDGQIEILVATIKEDGTWPGIDYQDFSREGFLHRIHANNMLLLARAYKTEHSKFYNDGSVKKSIELALTNWVSHVYISDNWWYNQIGIPNSLVSLMLVIGEELPEDLIEKAQPIIQKANIQAQGARPGGDRIKIAGIEAKNMLFLENRERFDTLIKVIEEEIKKVAWIGMTYGYGFRDQEGGFNSRKVGGRGIQYDYSFHHRGDGVNNTLSYGLGYADAFIEWACYVADTQYAFSNQKLEELIDYFLDGICKTAIYGQYPDPGAKNRSISRPNALKPYSATMAQKLFRISTYRKKELQEIIDIRKNKKRPTTAHATFFRHSEHFTFQRPDFFTSVRMYSTRTHNMEVPYNSEGLLNHYRGDGANHISVNGDEYYNIWPVYDYRKIPGTTTVQSAKMPVPEKIAKLGITDFVGAVTDGKYGAVAFDFKNQVDTLAARKSWFLFDHEYLCLGAGISSDKEKSSVATTLNQSLLRTKVTLSRNNITKEIDKGEKVFENVDWVFQDKVGYLFTKPTTIYIRNRPESGSWWRINKQANSPKTKVTLDVFSLWLDHGVQPKDASYEYIVVPATSVEKLERTNITKTLTVLSNTPYLQAVRHNTLGICQIIFYKAGEIRLTDHLTLRSDTPGIVMLKTNGRDIKEISVADPNRELGKMHLSLSAKIKKKGGTYGTLWDKEKGISTLSIEMPSGVEAGKSVTILF